MSEIDSLRARLAVARKGLKQWAEARPQTREHRIFSRILASEVARAMACHDLDQMASHMDTVMHILVDSGPSGVAFAEDLGEVADALRRWRRRTGRHRV